MVTTASAAAAASSVPGAAASRCHLHGHLPDPRCTPGAIDPRVTQAGIRRTICVSGYTRRVRPPSSVTGRIKDERIRAYGLIPDRSRYELDHLVALELGGAPADRRNLFPQPYAGRLGARAKDRLENELHRRVCAGRISLARAQRLIASNWVSAFGEFF